MLLPQLSSILVMALLAGSSIAMPQPAVAKSGAVANPVGGGLGKTGGAGPIKTQVMPSKGINAGNAGGDKKKKIKGTTAVRTPGINDKGNTGGKDKKKPVPKSQTGVNGNTGGKDKKKPVPKNQTGVKGNTGGKDKKKPVPKKQTGVNGKTGLKNQKGPNANTGTGNKNKNGLNGQKGKNGVKGGIKDKKPTGTDAKKAGDTKKPKKVTGAPKPKKISNGNRPANNNNQQQPNYYNSPQQQTYGSQNSYTPYSPPAYSPPSYNPSYTPSYNAQPAYAAPAAQYYNSYPRTYYRR